MSFYHKRERKKGDSISLPDPVFKNPVEKTGKKWSPEYIRQVYYLSLLGLNEVQMAQVLNIQAGTLQQWKHKYPPFLKAIQKGKILADTKVVESLYKSALGAKVKSNVVVLRKVKEFDPKTNKVVREETFPEVVTVDKHYPPNVQAAIKWLEARHPGIWGNKVEVHGNVNHNHKLDLTKLSDEELQILLKVTDNNAADAEDIDFEEIVDFPPLTENK